MPDAIPVPPEAVTAASAVLWGIEGTTPPFTARVAEYVAIDSTGPERDAEMAEFRAADAEAQRLNDDLVRRALDAVAPYFAAAERERLYTELGNDHYVIFTRNGWTVEHSVECRLSGRMHACDYHAAIVGLGRRGFDEDLTGRWLIEAIGPGGDAVLARADLPGDPGA